MYSIDWYTGLASVLVVTGSCLYSGDAMRRLLLGSWTNAPALLATLVFSVSLMVVTAEALGAFGLLTKPALLAAAVLLATASWLILRKRKANEEPEQEEGEDSARKAPVFGRAAGIAIAALLLVALEWVTPGLNSLEAGMYGGDTLWYHMPFSAHFAQTGSINSLLFVDTQYLNWFYPQNSELIHAIFIVLLGTDFLSPVINYFWLALGALAGWCIGRPYGAALPAALAVILLMSLEVISSRQPGSANNDAMVIALLLAAIAIAATAWKKGSPPTTNNQKRFPPSAGPALIAAGLAIGLAAGAKLTALAPGFVLVVGLIFLLEKGKRLRWGVLLIASSTLTGAFWMVRNFLYAGNPLPWLSFGPFARAGELTGREPAPILDYLFDPGIWTDWIAPGLSQRLGPFWLTLLLGCLVGLALGLFSRDRLKILIAASGTVALIAYILIPLGAAGPEGSPTAFAVNVRYMTPALAAGFVLLALPPKKINPRAWIVGVSSLYALALLLSFVAGGGLDLEGYPAAAVGAAFLVLTALPVSAAVLWVLGSRSALGLIVAGWLAGIFLLGAYQESRYTEYRYSSESSRYPTSTYPAIELGQGIGPLNDLARNLHDRKIGLSGSLAQYYQYGVWGPDLSNDVRAVGIETEKSDLNAPTTCEEWIQALQDGDFDLVITSPPVTDRDPGSATTAVEDGWIGRQSADLLLKSRRVAVWELDRRSTDPGNCKPS